MSKRLLITIFACSVFCGLSPNNFAQATVFGNTKKNKKQQTIEQCSELSIGKPTRSVSPVYPANARNAGIGGAVKVHLKVNENGKVDQVFYAEGPTELTESAKEAAKSLEFSPTKCNGKNTSVMGVITYNFRPETLTSSYLAPEDVKGFSDIPKNSPYYEALSTLTEKYKLAFGFADRKFYPNNPITKGELSQYLYSTINMLENRAIDAGKNLKALKIVSPLNVASIKSTSEIIGLDRSKPYYVANNILFNKYRIALIDKDRKFRGNLPLTNNEVIDYWAKIFGKSSVPVNFNLIENGDRLMTRGEFALFLRESLYVLTYQTLP